VSLSMHLEVIELKINNIHTLVVDTRNCCNFADELMTLKTFIRRA
jgi:hypothetical protein